MCIGRRHFVFLLNIQAKLYFFLGFRLKIFQTYRVHGRKFFQPLYAKTAQELFGRPKKDRPSRRIQSSKLFYKLIFYQFVDRMVTFYPIIESVSSMTSVSAGFLGCRARRIRHS